MAGIHCPLRRGRYAIIGNHAAPFFACPQYLAACVAPEDEQFTPLDGTEATVACLEGDAAWTVASGASERTRNDTMTTVYLAGRAPRLSGAQDGVTGGDAFFVVAADVADSIP